MKTFTKNLINANVNALFMHLSPIVSKRRFSRFLLTLTVALIYLSVNATNYYVSSSTGNDSNTGTSESSPWKTLTKVNSFTPKAGDQILFKRGDNWTGTITVKASGTSGSPIVYGAYGSGEKPVIYGSEVTTGWTLHSGNIWKATVSNNVNQLFVDGSKLKAARYPNSGYATINTINSANSFTCTSLSSSVSYNGAKWIARTSPYSLETLSITSSSGNTLTLSDVPYPDLNLATGFILVGKLEFLDSAGEWYYDTVSKTVYVWLTNNDSPANHSIRVSTNSYGINGSYKNYITIKDLAFNHNSVAGISITGSNLIIDNNTISMPDAKGITIASGSSNTISNNLINGSNHSGIEGFTTNSIYTDNTVYDISLFNGLGLSGVGNWYNGSGIYVEGDDNLIKYNRVTNMGYNGIQFHKRNTVEYNYVSNVLLTKDDGGGIYTSAAGSYPNAPTAGSIIRYNIVDGVLGSLEGCNPYGIRQGFGIYLDENSGGVTVEYNTTTNVSFAGIYLHLSYNETVRYNTSFNNGRQFHINTDMGGSNIHNNIFWAMSKNMENNSIQILGSQRSGSVTINNNTYVNHYNSSGIFRINETTKCNFDTWKTTTGQDAASTIDVTTLAAGESEQIFYNDTKLKQTVNLGTSVYKDINGATVTGSFTLDPFTSRILIKTTSVVSTDTTKPTVAAFSVPETSASLVVSITNFTASDNKAVTGYLVTESATAPLATNTGWTASAPTSYTFASEGTKTLYAWAKDAAGNVSSALSSSVTISLSDVTKPTVIAFSVPQTSTSLTVAITSFTASDNKAVTGYLVTESATAPLATNTGWTASAPTSYTFASEGTKTLYAWTKDAAGNVSASATDQVIISLSSLLSGNTEIYDLASGSLNLRAMALTFSVNASIESLSVYHGGGTGNVLLGIYSDLNGYPSAILGVTTTTTVNATAGWQTVNLINPVNVTAGQTVWLAWVFQNSVSVRFTSGGPARAVSSLTWTGDLPASFGTSSLADFKYSIYCSYSLADTEKPVVSAFSVPQTSTSLVVSITSFTASDNKAVTGYLVTESATAPLATNTGWTASAPASYTFATEGTKTLYAWTKDAAGNVSSALSSSVTISLPDVTKPTVTAFSVPQTSASLVVSITSFTASDNKAVTGYLVTESATAPLATNTGWTASAPTSYTFASEGTKTLYAWTKDAAGNVSSALSSSVTISLPDVTKPTVTAFSVPQTSASLVVSITSFTASDNKAVTGYLVTESATAPLATNTGWTASAPASYTFASEGTKTLYAWTKDAAGNVSSALSSSVTISLPDVTKPVVSAFSIPQTSTSLVVSITSFTASDNKAVTGYLVNESATAPLAGDAKWTASAPTSYTFASEGTKTLYAWTKDAAGNISASKNSTVIIDLPDDIKPEVIAFSVPDTSASLTVPVIQFVAVDNKAVTGYLITESAETPAAGSTGWSVAAPGTYSFSGGNAAVTETQVKSASSESNTFSSDETRVLYAWTKDAAGNVSAGISDHVVIALPDVTAPQVTAFSVPQTSASLTVEITSFTADDNKAVTGYMATESATAPLAENTGWTDTAPVSYTFASEGTKTLYAWAKDAAGNVSSALSSSVMITIPTEETNSASQFIELRKGWNIFSAYLVPQNINMEAVMQNLLADNKLIKVEDEYGRTYSKVNNSIGWVNKIGDMQQTEGYKICVSANCILEIKGQHVSLPLSIPIRRGSNLISFPLEGSVDAMQVLKPLIDAGILYKVQDERGNSIEKWKGIWMNGIGNFNSGEGYIVQALGSGTLVINNFNEKSSVQTVLRAETSYFQTDYNNNGFDHMNINITDLDKTGFKAGDEIAVFDGNICVGAVKLTITDFENNSVSIPASAAEMIGMNGFADGNPVEVKAWSYETNEVKSLQLTETEGTLAFNKFASVFVEVSANKVTGVTNDINNMEIKIYPNPVTERVNIAFTAMPEPGTKISLLDITGRELEGRNAESMYETFDVQHLPAGIYMIKTELNNNFKTQKIIKK